MAIDTSMYGRMNTPDIGGAIEDGLRMKDLMAQRKEKDTLKSAYSKNMTKGPNGEMQLNEGAFMSELAAGGVAPETALQFQDKFKANAEAKRKSEYESHQMIGNMASAALANPGSWPQIREQAIKLNLAPADQIPEQFDKSFLEGRAGFALTQLQRLDQANKERGFGLDEQKLVSAAADRKEARDERRFQSGIKMDEKVQGLKTPYGLANTETDAKDLKSAFEAKKNFDSKLDQLIGLREKHGGGALLNRDDVARGKQLSKDLLLQYKDMAKLGVLSQSDENILNEIIPEDPLAYNSPLAALQGQDPTLHRLKSFKSDSEADFQTKIGTRTRSGIESVASAKPQQKQQTAPAVPKQSDVVDGYVFLGGDPSNPKSWKPATPTSVASRQGKK